VVEKIRSGQFARYLIAAICMFVSIRISNLDAIAHLTITSPPLRDVSYFAGAVLCSIAIAFIGRRRPRLIRPRIWTAAAMALCAIGGIGFLLSMSSEFIGTMGFFFFIHQMGGVWASIVFGVALCERGDIKFTAICICAGYAIAQALNITLESFEPFIRYILFASLPILELLLMERTFETNIERLLSKGSFHDHAISQPSSYLAPLNPAFVNLMVFQGAFGFGLALNCVSGIPIATPFTGVVAAVLGIWITFSTSEKEKEDFLFQIALLLIIAGLLLALASFSLGLGAMSNIVLSAGSFCLTLLNWLVRVSIGSRNRLDALYAIAWTGGLASLGTLLGASTGHIINYYCIVDNKAAIGSICIALFLFLAYCVVLLRKFSFNELIHGVEPVAEVSVPAITEDMHDRFEAHCNEIGDEHSLTKREKEIAIMLAQGRNSKFIQDRLVVSYNTVKTHVKHIYMKLGIHSQQELIDMMVEH